MVYEKVKVATRFFFPRELIAITRPFPIGVKLRRHVILSRGPSPYQPFNVHLHTGASMHMHNIHVNPNKESTIWIVQLSIIMLRRS